eukprot:4014365-Pleurochrysis_carterae.AAC.1
MSGEKKRRWIEGEIEGGIVGAGRRVGEGRIWSGAAVFVILSLSGYAHVVSRRRSRSGGPPCPISGS